MQPPSKPDLTEQSKQNLKIRMHSEELICELGGKTKHQEILPQWGRGNKGQETLKREREEWRKDPEASTLA